MKLNKNFALRQVADTWVVLPLGDATANFNSMLTLNESGALLWKTLEKNDDVEALVKILKETYEVDHDQAYCDVVEFLNKLEKVGCLEK